MAGTCNSCGAFEGPVGEPVECCLHCPTLVCIRCRYHHESVCEQNQKRKKLGLGPTVRQNLEIPIAHPEPVSAVDQGLAGIAKLLQE